MTDENIIEKPESISPISLRVASQKLGINYKILTEWGKEGKIAFSKRGNMLMTDLNSIQCYLDLEETFKKQEKYLTDIIEEKQEEVNSIIAVYDDYIFSMRTLEKTTPLFKRIVQELSSLIKEDANRRIFIEIALGRDIYNVAKRNDISYDKICSLYKSLVDLIDRRGGLIDKYQSTIQEQELKIKELSISIRNFEAVFKQFEKYGEITTRLNKVENIPPKAIYHLSLSIRSDLQLDTRTKNGLVSADIETVENLIRYLYSHDGRFSSLLENHILGKVSYNNLKKELSQRSIIDENEYSYLLEYL